ncbi:hypothetical protein BJI69_08220 [Luteibacter rhizovicinus DSM 16549]|uniref:Uncharacterized protein n=1 Tax=Luteibacter rhizovicinus DSM 16549 TaxID=1440763 RepID=A0A1L3ESA3_9GAMM|nr:hypothetical protein [Luteibacter rhizovicinus]APG03892.1 hypothetical protein BJI69_08220 [Luteibacter rhizovicinus DSM 16549]
MLDTIDILETIGSDASLRHAHTDALSAALEQLHASPALTSAAVTGDSSELFAELGVKRMFLPQVSQV